MKKFLLLLVLTGCLKVGPDFRQPPVPIQEEWLETTETSPVADRWWTIFHDPVLEHLIGLGRANNLTLKIAGMRILESRALFGIAVGEWFPQLQEAEGSATRIHISKNSPNSRFLDRQYWDFILGFQAAWELDFWGRFRRGIEAAGEQLNATVADFDDVLVILLGDVASTYVTIRTLEERIAILEQNVALQERSLEISTARWQAGMVTELDVQQARTLLYSTRSRLPVLETERRTAKNALAVLLGLTPVQLEQIFCERGMIPASPKTLGAGIPAQLLTRRPDVRRALFEAASQSARIGVAVSDLLPRISLVGFIGLNAAGDNDSRFVKGNRHLFSSDSISYFFGPDVRWPILNYGRLMNRVYVERARFCEALLAYQNTVLLAYEEVESALTGFYNAQKEVAALDESVAAAKRSTELSRTQYVEGIADYTRVLNTQQAQLEEQERLVAARGDIALNLVAAYRALGGGWQQTAPCDEMSHLDRTCQALLAEMR